MENKSLNVWQKLLFVRKGFLEANVKKTGINRHLEFKYFELEDIVPTATKLACEYGLLFCTSFTNEEAKMDVIDIENPSSIITFTSPMREIDSIESSKTGGKLTNAVQNLGSQETYQRRYLYMLALDITEHDTFDGETGEMVKDEDGAPVPAPKKRTKKVPVSEEERAQIKKEVVDSDGAAEPLQVEAVKGLLEKLLELDQEQESFVQEIIVGTDKLTTLTKAQAALLINELNDLVASYEVVNKPTEG